MLLRILAKVALWIYAITGSLYFLMHTFGNDVVEKYAVGPLWLLMMIAPAVLWLLIIYPIVIRLGLIPE